MSKEDTRALFRPGESGNVDGAAGSCSAWLIAIVALAAALRLFPIWFGLPYSHARPDEETALGHAVEILRGDPNPHFFHWPSLTFYVLAGLFRIASLVRGLFAGLSTLSNFETVLLARGFIALAGTATVVVLYRIGRRLADSTTGVLAALMLAVSILHVRESHFAMTDVLMTFFVMVSLGLLLRAYDRSGPESTRWFAAAGLAGGLAASTKYSAAAIAVSMGTVQLLRLVQEGVSPLPIRTWVPSLVFGAAFCGGFIAGTPYALLDYAAFRTDLVFDFTHLSSGHAGVDLGSGWRYHLLRSLPFGAGVTIFVAAITGVVPMARQHGRRALILATFFIGLYAALGSGTTVFFRYIVPLIPLVCLSAAVAVRHGAPWLAARSGMTQPASFALLIALTAGPALVNSVWMDALLARTDTRVLAGRWLQERLTPEATVHDAGGSYTQLQMGTTRFRDWRYDRVANSFGDPAGRTPDWLVLNQSPVRAYTWAPAALRGLAASRYELVHTVNGTRDAGALRGLNRISPVVYDLQDAFFLPLSGFHTVERPGPNILIYRRSDLPPLER